MINLFHNRFYFGILFLSLNVLLIPKSYSRVYSIVTINSNVFYNKIIANQPYFKSNFSINPTLFKFFGPLLIDMNNIKYKDGIFFVPTLNDKSKPLFLAIDCNKSLINVKGSSHWKGWADSFYSYENRLLRKLCGTIDKY